MRLIQVFEPPMCCSTGVCGPEVDPVLAQFTADLDALRSEHMKVERFNLSQSPHQFATTPAVLSLLREQGAGALPAVLVDGRLAHYGSYPEQSALAALATGAPAPQPAQPSPIERTRAALENGRSVFICVANGEREAFLEPFRRVAENPGFEQGVDLIEVTGDGEEERALMTEVGLPLDGQTAAAVLIAPPGYITAQWSGSANADDVLVRVLQSSARCSPGGGCCG